MHTSFRSKLGAEWTAQLHVQSIGAICFGASFWIHNYNDCILLANHSGSITIKTKGYYYTSSKLSAMLNYKPHPFGRSLANHPWKIARRETEDKFKIETPKSKDLVNDHLLWTGLIFNSQSPLHLYFTVFFLCISQDHHFSIVGGWTNPVEKYARQIGSVPQASGWKHHLVSWPSKVSSSQLDGWKSMDPEPLKILHDANVVVRDKIDGHALSTWKLRWLLVSFFGGTKPFSIVKKTVGYCWNGLHFRSTSGFDSPWPWHSYIDILMVC